MKYWDKVEVTADSEEYAQYGIYKGMIGFIDFPEIRGNQFHVLFPSKELFGEDIYGPVYIKDLKVLEESDYTDEKLLELLPKNNPRWWCKVEDGFVYNLKGEKMNKIAYDYDSYDKKFWLW